MQINKTNSGESKKASLAEILDIFSQIDLKIIDLHKCSSDDFLALNSALKDNYKKAKLITDITTNTFNKIGKSGNINTLKLVKQDFSKLIKQIKNLEKKIDNSLDHLDIMLAKLSMMPVPLNNFMQNLSVLKLLFSNIKLTNSFYDNTDKNFSKAENQKIETTIKNIKENCQPLEEKNSTVQSSIKSLYNKLSAIKKDFLGNLIQNIEKAQNDLNVIEKHNKNAIKSSEQLNELSKQCSANVESIITNLQYHDIIRQKMEHIQKTHQLIIDELNSLNKTNEEEKKEASKIFSYVIQIPQISEIQTAQLLHANKEFQDAIDLITGKMNEIGQNMSQAAKIYKSLAIFKDIGEEISIDNIDEAFNNILLKCSRKNNIVEQLNKEAADVNNAVLKMKEYFVNIDFSDNSIEQMAIEKINAGNYLKSSSKKTASQSQQIIKLYADNRYEKNKLKDLFAQTLIHLNTVNNNNSSLTGKKQGLSSLQNIADKANEKILNIKEFFNYLNENKDLVEKNSNEIIRQNKNAVKEARYYAYFEESIDEIIKKFNKISNIVKSGKLAEIKTESDEKDLKQLEEYYTMKTERIIHNQTLSDLMKNQDQASEKISNEDHGNDVEFF